LVQIDCASMHEWWIKNERLDLDSCYEHILIYLLEIVMFIIQISFWRIGERNLGEKIDMQNKKSRLLVYSTLIC
jgi:hypothetical protein